MASLDGCAQKGQSIASAFLSSENGMQALLRQFADGREIQSSASLLPVSAPDGTQASMQLVLVQMQPLVLSSPRHNTSYSRDTSPSFNAEAIRFGPALMVSAVLRRAHACHIYFQARLYRNAFSACWTSIRYTPCIFVCRTNAWHVVIR